MTRALPYNESLIIGMGWFYDLHIAGGWTHMDVRDDEGRRIPFNTPAEVVRYLDIEGE